MSLKNDLFLRALTRQPTERTPSWMMRQAGRYLPEYMATRSKAGNFLELCKTPELACEVTLQPLARYPLDAAILFSDILTIPDALGLGLYFAQGEGPHFERPIQTEADVKQLGVLDINESLNYVTNAVRIIKRELNDTVPLIGFAGSPWTLATYMVEGKPSKSFAKIKKMMYTAPELLHQLLNNLAVNTTNYLNAQIENGVNAVQIFDTWGGVLGHREYLNFSLKYMEQIIANLKHHDKDGNKIPVIVFTKGGGLWLEDIAKSGCDCVGVDWTVNLATARKLVGDKVAIQGNMDPTILYATPERIALEVQQIVSDYSCGFAQEEVQFNIGHVFNLGHGILPDVNPEAPAIMLEALRNATAR